MKKAQLSVLGKMQKSFYMEVKNNAGRPVSSIFSLMGPKAAPDPVPKKADHILAPKSKTQLLAEVPEESACLANFISRHTKKTYLFAVQEFIAFHEITGADELFRIDQAHIITWYNYLITKGPCPGR